jgi:serine/threonine protein kinase
MIGTKLAAHYEITSHLGSGGMGQVYEATDAKLSRSVAIKILRKPSHAMPSVKPACWSR